MRTNDIDYKVAIGAFVKERLSRNPSALQLPSHHLDIFVVRDFLSATECAHLMRRIDAERIPSPLMGPRADPEFRTSESCNMQADEQIVRQIEDNLSDLMGIPIAHGEIIQGQRYAVGQQFKPHHDFFHVTEPYWPAMERCGGQRTWTAMIFLNAPEGGGETAFPDAGLKIAPRAGNLLAWNNLDVHGQPNPRTLHQGCPVTAGTKYIITKWYRERHWSYSNVVTY